MRISPPMIRFASGSLLDLVRQEVQSQGEAQTRQVQECETQRQTRTCALDEALRKLDYQNLSLPEKEVIEIAVLNWDGLVPGARVPSRRPSREMKSAIRKVLQSRDIPLLQEYFKVEVYRRQNAGGGSIGPSESGGVI